ncbi:hypothetical protein [Candidatus Cyanaurora vandensis]|uniref:hypothetical protein n=1 Tax=Candidatus Cyanaurora vandensis TaxID=2714958 RepID=UPI00257D1938|nr:hypothetical protein [Candidatus Cyanaurora vandensis]
MAVRVSLNQQRWIFGGLLVLTVALGLLAAVWLVVSLQAGSTVLAFGLIIPQWVLPALMLYLSLRNLLRLWGIRAQLLNGTGTFDLSGTLLGRVLNPPSRPNRKP